MTGLNEFKIKEVYEDDQNVYRALYNKDDNIIRVEVRSNLSSEEAKSLTRSQVTKINALFANAISPYPGAISDEIVCPEEFKPVYKTSNINGLEVTSLTGFLNNRLVFGACSQDQAAYKDVLSLFYCKKPKSFFTFELIKPNNQNAKDFLQTLSSLRCK
ncbi:MAG: hypothetical protein Q7S03_03980 [bacterium]|nr:hypothetical protein [bacterium]